MKIYRLEFEILLLMYFAFFTFLKSVIKVASGFEIVFFGAFSGNFDVHI